MKIFYCTTCRIATRRKERLDAKLSGDKVSAETPALFDRLCFPAGDRLMRRPQRANVQDVFTYFVLADFGKAGIAWVERSVNDADRKSTVADISSGQWGDVMTILECNPAENICNDVTEELLREAGRWDDEPAAPIDTQAARFDHARDLRKHEAA